MTERNAARSHRRDVISCSFRDDELSNNGDYLFLSVYVYRLYILRVRDESATSSELQRPTRCATMCVSRDRICYYDR